MLSCIYICTCAQMIFANPLPAAVAGGDGDMSDVSPLHSLPTRSRAQALNKRVKGECVCVRVHVYVRVCVLGVEGMFVACCPAVFHEIRRIHYAY